MKRNEAEKLLSSTGWLSKQPAEFRSQMLRRCQLTYFDADEWIFQLEDAPGGIYGIAQGSVAVFIPVRDPELPHRIANVLRPGIWFGYGPLLDKSRRTLAFRALEPTMTMRIDLAAARELGALNQEYQRVFGSLANQATSVAIDVIRDLLIPQMERRIAATLLRICSEPDGVASDQRCSVRLSQTELAELANASRHSANRLLQRFERLGWIEVGYRQIKVFNPQALARFSCSGDDG